MGPTSLLIQAAEWRAADVSANTAATSTPPRRDHRGRDPGQLSQMRPAAVAYGYGLPAEDVREIYEWLAELATATRRPRYSRPRR